MQQNDETRREKMSENRMKQTEGKMRENVKMRVQLILSHAANMLHGFRSLTRHTEDIDKTHRRHRQDAQEDTQSVQHNEQHAQRCNDSITLTKSLMLMIIMIKMIKKIIIIII